MGKEDHLEPIWNYFKNISNHLTTFWLEQGSELVWNFERVLDEVMYKNWSREWVRSFDRNFYDIWKRKEYGTINGIWIRMESAMLPGMRTRMKSWIEPEKGPRLSAMESGIRTQMTRVGQWTSKIQSEMWNGIETKF